MTNAPYLYPTAHLHKLRGSFAQAFRTFTLYSVAYPTYISLLFCINGAACRLDTPNVDLIIWFNRLFSRDDHLYGIGRTACGECAGWAIMFILLGPGEGYVDVVLEKFGNPIQANVDEVFKKGFGEW